MRIGVQSRACQLQGSNGLRAIHCREIEQELFQCFPSFQVIEQVLYGRTRPAEHGDTALNPWVFLYDLIFHCRLHNAGTVKSNDTAIRNRHENTLSPMDASFKLASAHQHSIRRSSGSVK